jgi:ArsR family transcriptional regulator
MRNLVKVFKALGDQNRIRILKMLQDEPMSVGQLTAVLGISQPAVSRHLRQLREAGLVEDRLTRQHQNQYVPVLLRHLVGWANQDSQVSSDHRKMGRVGRSSHRRAAPRKAGRPA